MADNELPAGFTLDQPNPLPPEVAKSIIAPADPSNHGLPNGFKLDAHTQDLNHGLPPGFELDSEKYGSLGQQALTVAEGAAQGLAGPLATAAEAGLTKLGVPGLSPEAQEGRAKANPIEHYGSELAGFIAPAVLTGGESALAKASLAGVTGRIGEGAAALAAKAGLKSTSTISRIASGGVRTGAEMMALQAGDEISKAINEKPDQSIGSAAINIGLSGVLGGVGGVALGGVGSLFKSGIEKSGAHKIIDKAKGEYDFLRSIKEGDVHQAVTNEVGTRLNELDNIGAKFGELKGKELEAAMPPVSAESAAKIDKQVSDISSKLTQSIEGAKDNAYLKGSVPRLKQDFTDFLSIAKSPETSYAEKFDAINALKQALDKNAKYSLTATESKFGEFSKKLANELRPMLEDSKVWGSAGTVQKESNRLYSEFAKAQKDAIGKLATASNVEGGYVADPIKIKTLLNQTEKGTAGLKSDFIDSYIKAGDRLADKLNETFVSQGLEAPVRLTPTPALEHVLNTPSDAGTKLGKWIYENGLAHLVGHTAGQSIGAGLGHLVGHPIIGGIVGEKMLSPIITTIAKPLLENATRAPAMRASIDYISNVIKGGNELSQATANVFKKGSEIIGKNLIPTKDSRDKLEKSLAYMNEDPNRMLSVSGELGHYMPEHATAAAATAAQAVQYLNDLKPKHPIESPLDTEPPASKAQQSIYDRALDVAQQPLMVLQHLSKGTLLPQDVHTLQTIYPGLYSEMVKNISNQVIDVRSKGHIIPYNQRLGIAMLTGAPVDSTMTPQGMRSIMQAQGGGKSPQQQPQHNADKKPASNVALRQINKVNAMYQTPLESRATNRRG